jgi:hypothetical protein
MKISTLSLLRWPALSIFIFLPSLSSAAELGSKKIKDVMRTDENWLFAPAVNGGKNKLLTGYDGYEDLGNLGGDLYMQPPADPDGGAWRDLCLIRLSFDWFPLQVPKGVNGLEEDIYSINASLLYKINFRKSSGRIRSWQPFLGFGAGLYQDRIVLDTPATGKVSSNENHFGWGLSGGVLLPVFGKHFPFRLIPEVRYHRIKYVEGFATNMTYQVGLAYWPSEGR